MDKKNIKDIITLQRINNQFLSLIDSIKEDENKLNMSIGKVLDNFYKKYEERGSGLRNNHYFFNQAQFISSLYTYIVLPKERFFDLIPDKLKIGTLNIKWGLSNIKWGLKKKKDSYTFKNFLRRMRNAIAHGDIKVTENLEFTFTDKKSRNKTDKNQENDSDYFEVTFSKNETDKNQENDSDYFEVTFSKNEIMRFTQALAYWCMTRDIELKEL